MTTSSTELHVHATPDTIAGLVDAMLPGGPLGTGSTGAWRPAPWGPGLDSHRCSAPWRRGRAQGEVTVDLLPVGHEHTLLALTASSTGRRRAGIGADELHAVARAIRAAAEQADVVALGSAVARPPLRVPGPTSRPAAGAAPAAPRAVGYSGA